ncbi:hypothetical protein K402DRAFT_103993 [Aulographum hederae CBS 113979]|uniref:C3H1-type domain-containing protein n=1 Tax=Aulographum hederae CBS 113979 TaxID=1176131 RepID=A0A6G1GXM2_9PEZI|nr:hypothetical protein K402DRAFT_103993 [Aulographum hederae CBS 113979]
MSPRPLNDPLVNAPFTATRSQSRIPNPPRSRSSSARTMSSSETPAEKAIRAEEKARLDELHNEELLDRQATRAERKAKFDAEQIVAKARADAELDALKAVNAEKLENMKTAAANATLAEEAVHQAKLMAIEKNPAIINAAEVDSGESSLPPTAKGLDLCLPGIPMSEVANIWKGTFVAENLAKLRNNPSRVETNRIEFTADSRVLATSTGSRKDLASVDVWLEGFTNYTIIVQTLWNTSHTLSTAMTQFHQKIVMLSATYIWANVLNLALQVHNRAIRNSQIAPANWTIPNELRAANCDWSSVKPPTSKASTASKRSRADTNTAHADEFCGNWNFNRPCAAKPCRYTHACQKCKGEHPKKECTA